ncbi:MAG: glycosyltransferase family 39 protein [Acidobacteria bacterium]|nr:glycosyltransferase family 39 protein [Acidobacteriota bacterium]
MNESLENPTLELSNNDSENNKTFNQTPITLRVYFIENFYWFVIGFVIFILSFFANIASGYNPADEAWFLQVLSRINSGEILYKDISYGVTPLALYITAIFTYIFGIELLVIKILGSIIFTISTLLVVHIAKKLGLKTSSITALAFVLLTYTIASPYSLGALYTPLANLFFLSSFTFTLNWQKAKDQNQPDKKLLINLVIAGIFAGFCFMSKQNIGIYLLTALLAVVAINYKSNLFSRNSLVSFSIILFIFALVSALVSLPILVSGGMEKFIYYSFFNKTTYLAKSSISYFTQLSKLLSLLEVPLENISAIIENFRFLLPLLAFISLLLVIAKADDSQNNFNVTITIFFVASFLGVFPRVDIAHLSPTLPVIILALFYCLDYLLEAEIYKTLSTIISSVYILFLLSILLGYKQLFFSPDSQFSSLPHFQGILIDKIGENNSEKIVEMFSPYKESKETFLISPSAGFYYLISGLKNPTPFDYPLITTLGAKGEQEVIAAISEKKIKHVWIENSKATIYLENLKATALINYIETNMVKTKASGAFTLYSLEP